MAGGTGRGGPDRRAFLLAAAPAAGSAPRAEAAADPFAALRRRWLAIALGTGYDPAARAARPHWLRVLANDACRQAVAVPGPGLTAATFWTAGRVGPLAASSAASVLVVRRGPRAVLCVSEPPRTGRPLEIVWDHPVHSVLRAGEGVEVRSAGRRPRVRVTPGMACATHECEVALR